MIVTATAAVGRHQRRSWFYSDDFANLTIADGSKLNWNYLSQNQVGHFSPGMLLPIWLVAHLGHGHYAWAAASTVVWFAMVLVLVARVARALGARGWAVTAAVALIAVNVAWDSSFLWWAAQVNELPAVVGGLLLFLGHLRHREGARWGLPVAIFGFAVALACSEGAVLFLVPLAVISFAAVRRRHFEADQVRQLRSQWKVWVGYLVPVVLLVVLRSFHAYPNQSSPAPIGQLISFPLVFLIQGYAPVTMGWTIGGSTARLAGPRRDRRLARLAGHRQVVRRPHRSVGLGRGIVDHAMAGILLPTSVLVGWARLGLLGEVAAQEPRYIAPVLWLGPLLAAGAWARRSPSPKPLRTLRVGRTQVSSAVIPVAVLVVLGMVGQVAALHDGVTAGAHASTSTGSRSRCRPPTPTPLPATHRRCSTPVSRPRSSGPSSASTSSCPTRCTTASTTSTTTT